MIQRNARQYSAGMICLLCQSVRFLLGNMSHQRVEERFKKLRRLMEGVPIHTFDVIVNSLFLLKHLNSEFARERQKVIEEYGEIFADDKDFYSDNAQCFLEKEAR